MWPIDLLPPVSSPRRTLRGRVVFITGAARGLGRQLALDASARGARVALVGRRREPLELLAGELGDSAVPLEADVADLSALEAATERCREHFGAIDVVVANAGVAPPARTLLSIDPEDFERTVDIDLLGQWRTIRATLPALIESRGHLVAVASIYSFINGVLNASYAASKAGVEQLVRALRVEAAGHGVTAGTAFLGFVETELASAVWEQDHAAQARSSLPDFVTRPMPVEAAAAAVLDGVEHRRPTVAAPWWVGPALTARGVLDLVDEYLIRNTGLLAAVRSADRPDAGEHR